MSNNTNPFIQSLPVELFHLIFRSVVNTYDRYILDMKLISKRNFHILCRLIDPGNVISLTLLNDKRTSDQIDFFTSPVCLRQFTRLRSLTLLQIDESQLNFILKRVNLNLLFSFSSSIRKYNDTRKNTTTALLSSVLKQSTLHKLELEIRDKTISEISWPIHCTIQHLTINHYITTDDLCKILQYSPHLHTLNLNKIFIDLINNLTSICFRQLTSL
jgi:hypothetical protein